MKVLYMMMFVTHFGILIIDKYGLNIEQVEGIFYVNEHLQELMFEELRNSCKTGGVGGFLPGMKQIANVAALPGIVGVSKN